MRRTLLALAGTVAVAASSPALAQGLPDFGWGPQYNNHLSPYDGRPLGPPLTAFGPVYDDGDPRSTYVTRYQYYNGRLVAILPNGRMVPVQQRR